ncbi:hypothetical protein CcaverHIS002_0309750 [Cutaneotrichosporon cavernicola]|uniref:Uncharacterized protein n=1 Tax=Cutaneotrichosporon cavernicola TaxID=279322 RepID=A0AA48KZT3_9TREE|nr:uncharacterized protein CcaverHIS019_0309590 [Cutaneotrichosporon cavernicola]BEI83107.1 hypothetical protein CcaverHIS002_0309750 [Cutaneotrichosporon cavernicola]BEI90889.1 hypothetical protein CcaverHIS019_0309590 [Cutaneotrichosporon cavernicola]BEI98668.1 hypothetical protein CcaverHIS631_0309670 [Cutaneotrichosporon cavernicola]BEJ06438.1 hypothetical protein CcaverHIS641_0309600 [Cutaneotrichosporon cavernicola]
MPAPQPPQSKPAYPRPAPYNLHGRRKRKRKDAVPHPPRKPEPAAIDSVMLPHIVERILELAPHEALVVLRGVNRALRERADARLAEHIVLRAPHPLKMHGVYIHSRGQLPTEFYGSVSDDIKLPGFAFFDGNAREPYSAAVQEREKLTNHNYKPARPREHRPLSLPARLLLNQKEREEKEERERRSKLTARARDWCLAALAHTRAFDLHGFNAKVLPMFYALEKHTGNVEVVRVANDCGLRSTDWPGESAHHLITSIDVRTPWPHFAPQPSYSMRTMTLFIDVPARRKSAARVHCYDPSMCVSDITVVLRAVPATSPPLHGPLQEFGVLLWSGRVYECATEPRITFVNISKDTQFAVGLELEDDQGANGGYEAAFMRALEQCAIRQFEPLHFPAVDPVEVLHRCVRVLSMEDWMAEASKDDREACLTFW